MAKKNKLQALINARLKQLSQESKNLPENIPNTKSEKKSKPQVSTLENSKHETETIETIELKTKEFKDSKYLSKDLIKIAIIIVIIIIIAVVIYIFRDSPFIKNISNSVFNAFNKS